MTKKYYIKTFGCQVNHSDSERIAAVLENNSLRMASNIDEADIVIFNTCGVRQMAEDRVYGQVGNVHIHNPKSKIILTGCLANRKDVQKRLREKVDVFLNISEISKIAALITKKLKNQNSSVKNAIQNSKLNKENIAYLSINPKHENTFSAYVPIMTGCNNFCSYCVVPYARGHEVSRPAGEIIKEVNNLVKNGYKEIILLGQNVNSYKDEGVNFSRLLKRVDSISGKFWISFMSSHPSDVTDEFIETVTKCKKVCEYVHLPVQSGNNEVLKKMNRKYTARHYLKLIEKIKAAYKKHKHEFVYSLTSDIIVGFPRETREQFLDSAEVMEKAGYDMVYFGQYSPRPGTTAWKMKDNVSKKEKIRREKYLNEILKKTAFGNNQKYLGNIFEVLVDNEKGDFYFGHTRTMKNVKFSASKKNLAGEFVKIKITRVNIWNLEGKIIK